MRLPAGRARWWAAGGAVLVVLAVALTWFLWPEERRPDPRSRVYSEASACLLTPAQGVVDKAVVPVWAGMQQASLETAGKVSFLEVDGPQTRENAATYLATLAAGGCDLVLAAGDAPIAALSEQADRYPLVRFVAVGPASERSLVNVVNVEESDPLRVTERIRDLTVSALSTQE
jgi:hypothetical protein